MDAATTSTGVTSTGTPLIESHPGHVPAELVVAFDHYFQTGLDTDPFATFEDLRGRRVLWCTGHGGHWLLTRADDILEAMQRPDVFSNGQAATLLPAAEGRVMLIPEYIDPPDHGKYRRPLAALFSPAVAVGLRERLRQHCVTLVDSFAGRGSCEFVEDFARPFPVGIFTGLFGLPEEETPKFLEWNRCMRHTIEPTRRDEATLAARTYLTSLIAERTANPGGDLLSVVLDCEVDGRRLSTEEALGVAMLLFMAGLDTVTSALSFSFAYLSQRPELQLRLVEDPSVVPRAVEELLRRHSFVHVARTVTADIDFAGVAMRRGDRLLLSTTLASRDQDEFPDPDRVDFDRDVTRHFAFGAGPHRCLGSHLARQELQIALEEFHRRIPDYRRAADHPVVTYGGGTMGVVSLHLEWDKP